MATRICEFDCSEGETTLTVELRVVGSNVLTASAAATEWADDKGSYTCSFIGVPSNLYKFRARDAANSTLARGLLQHTDAAGSERPAVESIVVAGMAGTGARTVTITVQTSGAVAIQGATVRVTLSGASYTQTTNSSGQVTFNLDDGTWTISITKIGYSYAGTTLIVDGTEAVTYQMTTNSVSAPAAPNLTIGTLLCLGVDGLLEAGVVITFRLTVGPGTAGYALDAAEFAETSDAAGEIEANFIRTAQYTARRGTVGREVAFTAADAASFSLPEALGSP